MKKANKAKARPRNKPKSAPVARSNAPSRAKPKAARLSIRNQYDGATTGRRLGTWGTGTAGPNAAFIFDLGVLRNRSRELARNDPLVKKAINSLANNEIGCGITFKAASSDQEFNKRADDLFERQSTYFDAEGRYDVHGLLWKCVWNRNTAGEVFIRRRRRRPSDGLPVPIQYQVLEPELCPYQENRLIENGISVRAGIQFDAIGKRQGYWMYGEHPNDNFFSQSSDAFNLRFVIADDIIHHYEALRPGQIRGIPSPVAAIIPAKDFNDYDDAELVRKKNRAAFTGSIQRPNFDPDTDSLYDPLTGQPINKDYAGVPVTDIQAGQFFSLLPGEEAKLFDGDTTGSGYEEFVRQQGRRIAGAMDVPYEIVTGDFTQVNDRTLRVVLAEFRRHIERLRWLIMIPQVCYPIWKDFIDMAILSGALPEPLGLTPDDYQKVACHPEGWPYLHALQDVEADVLALRAGLTSRKRIKSEDGEDVREIDAERQEDMMRDQEMGLTSDFGTKTATAQDPNADATIAN